MNPHTEMLREIAVMAEEYARDFGRGATAVEFALYLRTAADAEEKGTRGGSPHQGEPTPTVTRAWQCERIGAFFRCASAGRRTAAEMRGTT
ncbi:hypothetical protein [Streptomyces seoulensis]|uniref:hypothetical protein n=1 Tax=Streptomyces seoulensis TaxID=73044 RepID=UPI001FCBFDB7|nr:hypothetical protein [Streptomyces seoulensis]BDH04860.1 hypothetical protein HEK131_20870 [Streptomyces seoulensis]